MAAGPDAYNNHPANDSQWTKLMDALSVDREMLTGEFEGVGGVARYTRKWNDVAVQLNKIGNAKKTGEKWKDAWDNLIARAKKAMLRKTGYENGTGGGPPPDIMTLGLSAIHTRVLSLIPKEKLFGKRAVGDSLELQQQHDRSSGAGLNDDGYNLHDTPGDVYSKSAGPGEAGLHGAHSYGRPDSVRYGRPSLGEEERHGAHATPYDHNADGVVYSYNQRPSLHHLNGDRYGQSAGVDRYVQAASGDRYKQPAGGDRYGHGLSTGGDRYGHGLSTGGDRYGQSAGTGDSGRAVGFRQHQPTHIGDHPGSVSHGQPRFEAPSASAGLHHSQHHQAKVPPSVLTLHHERFQHPQPTMRSKQIEAGAVVGHHESGAHYGGTYPQEQQHHIHSNAGFNRNQTYADEQNDADVYPASQHNLQPSTPMKPSGHKKSIRTPPFDPSPASRKRLSYSPGRSSSRSSLEGVSSSLGKLQLANDSNHSDDNGNIVAATLASSMTSFDNHMEEIAVLFTSHMSAMEAHTRAMEAHTSVVQDLKNSIDKLTNAIESVDFEGAKTCVAAFKASIDTLSNLS